MTDKITDKQSNKLLNRFFELRRAYARIEVEILNAMPLLFDEKFCNKLVLRKDNDERFVRDLRIARNQAYCAYEKLRAQRKGK